MQKWITCYSSSDVNEYYRVLSEARFVLCPRGVGIDTHRVYETLLLGSYPIVKSSPLDWIYRDLPVLLVDDWKEVTISLLEETYRRFQTMTFHYSKLYMKYWKIRFRSHYV